MAKKTKKMAFGGSAGPMDNRPPMPSSGGSKAGSGQSINQGRGDREGRGGRGPGGGGRQGDGPRPDMGRPGMVRPGFPSGGGKPSLSQFAQQNYGAPAASQIQPRQTFETSVSPRPGGTPPPMQTPIGPPPPFVGQARPIGGSAQMTNPAQIKFPDQQSYDQYMMDYRSSAMKKGGAVKSKKMASGGMAKSSGGGRGWGKARGAKPGKVC